MSAEISQLETLNKALLRQCEHFSEKNEIFELKLNLERSKQKDLESKMKIMEGTNIYLFVLK
jgi:hypothetical protein